MSGERDTNPKSPPHGVARVTTKQITNVNDYQRIVEFGDHLIKLGIADAATLQSYYNDPAAWRFERIGFFVLKEKSIDPMNHPLTSSYPWDDETPPLIQIGTSDDPLAVSMREELTR